MSISLLRAAPVAVGGALLAAWIAAATTAPREDGAEFAAAPSAVRPARPEGPRAAGSAAAGLSADLERLRLQAADAPALRVGARNPFSLAPLPPPPRAAAPDPADADPGRRLAALPPQRVGPAHELIGVASRRTEEGPERIAILAAPDGEVLLAGAGDRVPGGWVVDAVEPSSVTLADGAGTRTRLVLP